MANEEYDISKVKERLREIIGNKADKILRVAGVSTDIVGLKHIIRLKKYLSAIFSKAIAEEILTHSKILSSHEILEYRSFFPKGSNILTLDTQSINTLSPMLADPLFIANILLSSEPKGIAKFSIAEGLDLGEVFSTFKVDVKGTYMFNIVSEDFEGKVLVSEGKIAGAYVRSKGKIVLALKALRFLSEYVGEVEVVLYEIHEKSKKGF